MIFSETNKEISAALAKAWGELENPKHNSSVKVKTKSGSSYTFDYTDLKGIFDAVKPIYKEHGISILQNAKSHEMNGNLMISVETVFLHESGEWVKSQPISMPSSTSMQDMGGQITYMKRYSLSALLGLATEKDDDANGASGNEYQMKSKSGNKASDSQLNFVNKLLKDKTSEKHPYQKLYEGLKARMNTDVDIENWSSQQASQAIQMLQGDKQ